MKRITALLLAAVLAAPGCAVTRPARQVAPHPVSTASDTTIVGDYARQLPVGSNVRAKLTNKKLVRGTLMKVTDQNVVIQPRGRVPVPFIDVPLQDIVALERETPSSGGMGRMAAIGAAAGAGAAAGVFLLLIALYSD
jgi:hypothetical protein